MKLRLLLGAFVFIVSVLGACAGAIAQGSPVGAPPPDPWPRVVDLAHGQVLVYQPRRGGIFGGILRFHAAPRVFSLSDTILATPGGVSSNSSLSARIDSLYERVVDSASCALSILPEFHEDRRDEILRKVKSTLR